MSGRLMPTRQDGRNWRSKQFIQFIEFIQFIQFIEFIRTICANAATNADGDLFDSVEFGTIEGGKLKREVFERRAAV